jgi:hypothetical protein
VSIPEKHAAEAEQYGLKIRQLVSPVLEHTFPPFRSWVEIEEDAEYPLENENKEARLGVIGTIGFIALLCALFAPRLASAFSDAPLFAGAGRLTLAAVLLATVGGFGSLFSLLASPEIRAYNRITPFISFFSLVAIALIAEHLLVRVATSRARPWVSAALIGALVIGLYDEAQAARPLNRDYNGNHREWTELGVFVRSLEARLPDGAMVFQLPALTYLNEIGHEKMQPLDLIKPYLPSTRVHWSFPALSDSIVRWQQQVGRLPTPILATALVAQGFNTVLIDRNGYFDRGQGLLGELGVQPSSHAVIAESERYIALDLGLVRKGDVAADRLPRLGGKATSATAGLRACAATTLYNLEWIGNRAAPFARQPVRVSLAGDFFVAGWAVDDPNQAVSGDVDVVVGDTAYSAFYPVDRPDVAKYLGIPGYRGSGFIVKLDGENVGGGSTLSLRILAADRSCFYQTPTIMILAQ